jgi:hypothetical protein
VKFASACHSLPVPLDPIAAIVAVQRTHRQRDPRRMSLQSAPHLRPSEELVELGGGGYLIGMGFGRSTQRP